MNNFNGVINEYPNIACDCFCKDTLKCSAFFLSHCHADHMVGLKGEAFHSLLRSNEDIKLYCSYTTKVFLINHPKFRHLKRHIVSLQMNQSYSLQVPDPKTKLTETVNVSFMNAKHCAGSVAILFEGDGGIVLYTGDCRLTAKSLRGEDMKLLYDDNHKLKPIQKLYIDTTFCYSSAKILPARSRSKDLLFEIIGPWLKLSTNNIVVLDCPYKFGCEYLFIELHKEFQLQVHISRSKYKQHKRIRKLRECSTDDGFSTQIHACRFKRKRNSNPALKECSIFNNKDVKILNIKLSAMYFTNGRTDEWVCEFPQVNRKGYRLCYSIHASCSEIQGFVKSLQPRALHPLVIPINSSLNEVCSLLGFQKIESNHLIATLEWGNFGALQNQSLLPDSNDLDSEESSFVLDLSSSTSTPVKPSCASRNQSAAHLDGESPLWDFLISPIKASQDSETTAIFEEDIVKSEPALNHTSPLEVDTIKLNEQLLKDENGIKNVPPGTSSTVIVNPSKSETEDSKKDLSKMCSFEVIDLTDSSSPIELQEEVEDCIEAIDLTTNSVVDETSWDSTPELILDS